MIKRVVLGVIASAMVLSLVKPTGSWSGTVHRKIHITVLDEQHRKPIPEASLTHDGVTMRSNHAGVATLTKHFPAGGRLGFRRQGRFMLEGSIMVSAEGYGSFTSPLKDLFGTQHAIITDEPLGCQVFLSRSFR